MSHLILVALHQPIRLDLRSACIRALLLMLCQIIELKYVQVVVLAVTVKVFNFLTILAATDVMEVLLSIELVRGSVGAHAEIVVTSPLVD